MAFALERAPQIAKDCGFEHVVAKLWWQNDELLAAEKANLNAAVDAVDARSAGSGAFWDENWQPKPVVELLATAL